MILSILWSCAPSPSTPPLDPGIESVDPSPPAPTVPPTLPPSADPIGVALAEACPDAGPLQEPFTGGMHRVTLPQGRCNDGTPAVMYIRGAADEDPGPGDDFVLFLEGGGSCASWETCRSRWCGEKYDAGKMSTQWTAETLGGSGLMAATADNAFNDSHRVQMPYCSSDLWLGDAPDLVFVDEAGVGPDYAIHFEGRVIFDAAIAALRAGVTSDDGLVTLPSLDDARQLLLTGTSAGAIGAAQALDGIALALPTVEVLGGIDSMHYPLPEALPTDDLRERLAQAIEEDWDLHHDAVWKSSLDDSCLAAVGDDAWRCVDLALLFTDHLATPFVVHQDLWDPVVYGSANPLGMELEAWADVVGASMRGMADTLDGASWRGTACGTHTSLGSRSRFFDVRVRDAEAGGAAWTLHDTLVAFREGQRVVAVDRPDGLSSMCKGTQP